MLHSVKKKYIKSSSKRAAESKYYYVIKPLLDQHGIRVQKWVDYDPKQVYWADFDQHAVHLPIPNCNWSCYICLHEIGHLVKGSRRYCYLQEYHAETYALSRVEKLNLVGFATMVKNGKKYVLNNTLQDIIFEGLNPNFVRREVRAWLGITPKRLRTLALRRCTMILKELFKDHVVDPFSKIDKNDKLIVKLRKQEICKIKASAG